MPDGATVRGLLVSLVAEHSVVSAIVATDDGDVIDVWPTPADPWEASSMAEWAAEQVERLSGLRAQIGEAEFSLLFDPHGSATPLHRYLQATPAHVLVVLFKDRDYLGRVRRAARQAAQQLARLLES